MNNPFDYTPDRLCEEAFRELLDRLETVRKSEHPADVDFCRELEAGKMLGVLVATDDGGCPHTLYAFSGQLGNGGFHYPGFVGPVFDYLQPDGYFKTRESEISRQNMEIARFEAGELSTIRSEYDRASQKADAVIAEYKENCRLSKAARDSKRSSGLADEGELAAMIRQSQFEKAELHRLKKRMADRLAPFADRLDKAKSRLDAMKEKRRADSEALQRWLFDNFRVLNARGESRSLSEIFADSPMGIPPSGAGECCAPKLLQAAYLRGWRPVSMAEYWYGSPKGGEVRIHGEHYPACRGKCLPVLGWMLRGLSVDPPLDDGCVADAAAEPEIVYENRWFCVVNKPGGMLSVLGKGSALSVQRWLEDKYGPERQVKMAHRLDQDTSGLLVATFGEQAYKVLQSLFARRRVIKTYVADLDGNWDELGIAREGRIALPLAPDWIDRPRQRVDFETGKEAVTDYEFINFADGRSRVVFRPLTGRTHQLRVHAASAMGLGMPIVGDRLYGRRKGERRESLRLHAHKLEFTFPIDGGRYSFEVPVPF